MTFGLLLEASGNRRRRGMAVTAFQAVACHKDDSQYRTRLTSSLGEFFHILGIRFASDGHNCRKVERGEWQVPQIAVF